MVGYPGIREDARAAGRLGRYFGGGILGVLTLAVMLAPIWLTLVVLLAWWIRS